MVNAINSNFKYTLNQFVYNDRPSFTIIRDPWERTISGLSYDLCRTFGDVTEEIIDEIDLHRIFYQPINARQRVTGFISHVSVQTGYLFDINPTFYIDLKNLSHFLNIHFGESNTKVLNQSDNQIKTKLVNILEKRSDIKDAIDKYLSIDYYFIERIKNTEIFWDFSMGKMWK